MKAKRLMLATCLGVCASASSASERQLPADTGERVGRAAAEFTYLANAWGRVEREAKAIYGSLRAKGVSHDRSIALLRTYAMDGLNPPELSEYKTKPIDKMLQEIKGYLTSADNLTPDAALVSVALSYDEVLRAIRPTLTANRIHVRALRGSDIVGQEVASLFKDGRPQTVVIRMRVETMGTQTCAASISPAVSSGFNVTCSADQYAFTFPKATAFGDCKVNDEKNPVGIELLPARSSDAATVWVWCSAASNT